MIPKRSQLLENLFTNDDACTDGLTSPLACPTPEPCEDAEKCAESFDADCVVFVNGKGEQMKMASNSNGWTLAADGVTFNLTGIGYEVNGEDEVYVIAPYRGDEETTGTAGGEDYEDFFNGRKK